MRRYVFKLTFLALAALGSSVVLGQDQPNDQQIANTILQKLKAEKDAGRLKGFSIDLKVETDGTAWLMGRVSSEEQQMLALNTAARVKGVTKVVNDLAVEQAPVRQAFTPVAHEIGSGVNAEAAPAPARLQPVPVQPMPVAPQQQLQPVPNQYAPQQQPVPVYARSTQQVPLAYGPARTIAYTGGAQIGVDGTPIPVTGGGAVGMAAARYDHPNMPGYAWPAYASHPNYAAVTYPKQYSPTAWPYIGPFYPYPQVPLGWRRVCLEWDDGWWFLDFNARRH